QGRPAQCRCGRCGAGAPRASQTGQRPLPWGAGAGYRHHGGDHGGASRSQRNGAGRSTTAGRGAVNMSGTKPLMPDDGAATGREDAHPAGVVLVINSGSSSLKYQVVDTATGT